MKETKKKKNEWIFAILFNETLLMIQLVIIMIGKKEFTKNFSFFFILHI